MFNKRGFTLAELLVVILIIAILASVGLVLFREAQKMARDGKRRQDLASLKLALELYYRKNNHYPCTTTQGTGAEGEWQQSTTQQPWIEDKNCGGPAFGTDYISQIPTDPLNSGFPWSENNMLNEKYAYAYWAGLTTGNGCPQEKGQYYILLTRFERSGQKDASPEEIVNLCDGETAVLSLIPAFDYGLNDLYILTSND